MAMQNAATKAGIPPNNLVIALEPEAAVLACLDKNDVVSFYTSHIF